MNKIQYNVSQIATIVSGRLIANLSAETQVKDLVYDSRKIQGTIQPLFFALTTAKNDGHRFIAELYEKGIQNFVVDASFLEKTQHFKANFIVVDNTLKALQELAKHHRKLFKIPIIGITGSNGKTAVKEWLYQLLCDDRKIAYTPNSFNSQIGVPISVWSLTDDAQIGIFEAGISQPNEMNTLKEIIEPTIGIFTNIGVAHDESFMDIKQKVGEKLNLFRNVEHLIFCADHADIMEVLMQTELVKKINIFRWSKRKKEADLYVFSIEKQQNKTFIKAIYQEKEISITIPFADDAAIENAISCWATMLLLGYKNELIAQRISKLTPIAMRLEMKQGINRCLIINDTYNSDFNSLQIAVDLMSNQQQYERRMVILSDILQSRSSESDIYREIARLFEKKQINKVVGIGEAITRQGDAFPMETEFYKTTDEFLANFDLKKIDNEIILVKGARPYNFERIANFLELKTHETVLEVNLKSLISNYNYYRSLVAKPTKIAAMVKAFSYGMGDVDVVNALQYHGCDYLVVAYADEAVLLRNKNIQLPIIVMNPEERSFDDILRYDLQPEIYNKRVLEMLLTALESYREKQTVKVHIKIDSGMHRLGFEKENLPELLQTIKRYPQIIVESVFTHLAAADDPQEDTFTAQQVAYFEQCHESITKQLGYKPLKHVANTSTISRFPQYHFDMVRLGLGLYGVNPFADAKKIATVATLKTVVSQLKTIEIGQTVGYNRTFTAEKRTTIATIPIGYADGLPRSAGNQKADVLINGHLAKIIGNICMDMCMVDVTDIPVKEGDTVILFGKDLSVSALAKTCNEIEYELFTGISQRVKRIYVEQ